ncbi:MAG: CotH kinase family protein, partial [Kofleriaceae bacterium]|nr:CotH kinase family protein [Kofleriaceae bacterium]
LGNSALGCSSDGGGADSPDAGAMVDASPADAGPDLTEAMFDPNHVLDIEVNMDPGDWDELRVQARTIFEVLGASCLEAPPPRPFTYFPASVLIDGEQVTNVGIRKKGFFGSLSDTKPSLKIKFSEYDPLQRFSGLKRMTLNNNKSDTSHIKQCIGYNLFAEAGIPSPRCSFAKVTMNGDYLGVFTHVESIKKPFIARHFADDNGNLYEGALSDFRVGWVETFQRKTNKTDLDRSDIRALVPALELPDDSLIAALEELVDLDSFVDFWVMETIMMHADGYGRNTNNFYIYANPLDGKFHFIPWGIDSILFPNTTLPWEPVRPPETLFVEGVLARRLYDHPDTRAQFLLRLEELLGQVWNEDELLADIDRMEALLGEHLVSGEASQFASSVTQVRNFVGGRRAVLEAEINASAPPEWNRPLRDPWCLGMLGTTSGTFTGQWADDYAGTAPFSDGTLSLDVDIPGLVRTGLSGGTTFGVDPDNGKNALRLVSFVEQAMDPQTQSSVAYIVIIYLADEDLFPQSMVLDGSNAEMNVFRLTFPPAAAPLEFEHLGIGGEGLLSLDEVGTTDGASLRGSFSVQLYETPF